MTNPKGRFGAHGGQYIPETLMNAVIELEEAYDRYKRDPDFTAELRTLLNEYANRPSLLYFAERMTADLGGAKVYLKREDLNHTGAHKINNALGQALLAKRMGKTRLIAETGAGQHGVATATVAALFGMECHVYMGVEDMERQALNVYRMRLMGAEVHGVDSGTGTLKDAVSECMREWNCRIADTHYLLGSCMGPHPFPTIVRDFQSFISTEIIDQCREREGRLPDYVVACVGGGSNAIGSFHHFIDHPEVKLIGCEAAGRGIDTFQTAATLNTGSLGIFHGMKSYFCQDEYGQIAPVYSISAGLDYPGIGPEHAWLHDTGRAQYVAITDDEAVDAFDSGNGKAFIPFITCGDPDLETTKALVFALQEAGADIIELGIPFSDPTAEGPVIQGANLRTLEGGVTTDAILDMVAEVRADVKIPLVFMTYGNIVYHYGIDRFCERARKAGIDGLILPDTPFEEKGEFAPTCAEHGISYISLIAPTSDERIAMIAAEAQGFVYCVSSLGVTGTRDAITTDIDALVSRVRGATDVPVAVGFGISNPEQAANMASKSDGAIVGSALVKLVAENGKGSPEPVAELAARLAQAVHSC